MTAFYLFRAARSLEQLPTPNALLAFHWLGQRFRDVTAAL
jgi:hypothetical protein